MFSKDVVLTILFSCFLGACSLQDTFEDNNSTINTVQSSTAIQSLEKQSGNKADDASSFDAITPASEHASKFLSTAHEHKKIDVHSHASSHAVDKETLIKEAQEVIDTIAKAQAKGLDLADPDDYQPNLQYGSLWESELFSEDRFMLKVKLTPQEQKEAKILARSFKSHMSRSTMFMFHLLSELDKRNLPVEIAAIPLVESGFKPRARSHANAHGPWQFTRRTGKSFGLKVTAKYDEFYDFIVTTNASLDYLAHLYKQFNNWDLALIAYNQGEFGVKRAIRRAKARGVKEITVQNLNLTRTARTYLSRIRAYSDIMKDPSKYNLEAPKIEYRAAFKPMKVTNVATLSEVAKLSGVDLKLLKHMNAGFLTDSLKTESNHVILIPVENVERFNKALADLSNKQAQDKQVTASR